MEKQFVPYELELKLKELGFDEECFGFYNNADGNVWIKHLIPDDIKEIYTGDISAPLWQQAFDWFMDNHKLHVMFETVLMSYGIVDCRNNDMKIVRFISTEDRFLNKSGLKTEALKELIELVETKKG